MCDHEEKPSAAVVETLVAHHRELLRFVEKRVGSREVAEEILQGALVKNVAKLDSVRDSALGWFYAVLRNAIIDYHRQRAAEGRRLEGFAVEREVHDTRDDELSGVVCQCVKGLATTLKPEYADALQRIEVEGMSVKDYAAQAGISSNNAGVRVFRAREALRAQVMRSCGTCAEHGCVDCTCGAGAVPS